MALPPAPPVSKLSQSLFLSLPVCIAGLAKMEWGGDEEPSDTTCEKDWFAINHSILSVLSPALNGRWDEEDFILANGGTLSEYTVQYIIQPTFIGTQA